MSVAACPACGAGSLTAAPDWAPAPLSRCTTCGALVTRLTEPGEVRALYGEEYFAAYDGGDYLAAEAQRRRESRTRLAWLAAFAPPPSRLLEIGAAAGFFLDEARVAGYEAIGVEASGAMAAAARERLGADVRTGFVEDVALEGERFEVVCAWHVVEHLPAPLAVVEALRSALVDGGWLAVEVPNAASALAHRRRAHWHALDIPHHVVHYSPESLRALLQRAGLEVVVLDTIPFSAYGPAVLRWPAALRESLRARRPLTPRPSPGSHQLLRALARRVA